MRKDRVPAPCRRSNPQDAPTHEAPDPNRGFTLAGLVLSAIIKALDTTIIRSADP